MKGKLIKTEVNYLLEGEGGVVIASTSLKKEGMSLSLKNCQAIELGYDLDEIKRKVFDGFDGQPNSFTIAAVERTIQIMFELMGDKKFSEEDMRIAFFHVQNSPFFNEFIQSLQQNEWDVEVQTEELLSGQCNCECHSIGSNVIHFMPCCNPKMLEVPKLDVDGRLILKRI